uniref:SET domain-containing protein n=1 Tax=Chenopodium quinoa TaxID=63459 RepID=A0A803ML63_CHEQI
MEKLKSIIPFEIKKKIEQSNTKDLPSTTSSLHYFFANSSLFHSMVEDLTNPELGFCSKNKETALELKNKGNACFSSSDYSQAAHFYFQALRVAPVDVVDKGNKLVAALFVNRASSFHAWYRRGKVNTSLLNYEDAICDLMVALDFEGTSSGKRQIQNDLKLMEKENQKSENPFQELSRQEQLVIDEDEMPPVELQCVSTPTKGRGMASLFEISSATLVHKEEPYAAIILKNFRDTHCHFCFSELPADKVPYMYHPSKQSGNLSLPRDSMTSNLEQACSRVELKYLVLNRKIELANNLCQLLSEARVGQAVYLSGSMFNHSCMPNIHAYFISRTLLIRATEYVPGGCPLEMSYGPQVGQWDHRNRQQFLLDRYTFKCQCNGCTRANLPDLVLNAFRCAKVNCSGVVLDDSMVEYEKHKFCHLPETPENHSMEHQREVDKLMHDEIKNVACLMSEHSSHCREIQSGCCLKCGSTNDLKYLHATTDEADTYFRSLQEAVNSNEVSAGLLSNALSSLNDLKSTLHSYNKKLAEAEDILAEVFCSVGEMQQAIDHCTISIQILKKLYSPGHIAVGNELVKLSSLQLALGDASAAVDTVHQMNIIFSNYYGKHAELMFPYLQYLKGGVVHKLADGRKS